MDEVKHPVVIKSVGRNFQTEKKKYLGPKVVRNMTFQRLGNFHLYYFMHLILLSLRLVFVKSSTNWILLEV